MIRTNAVASQSLTLRYTLLTMARVTRFLVKNWWVSFGFICRSVSICLFLSLTLATKNVVSSFDHSAVNVIVWWQALSVSINYFKESSSCSQMKNISLMYLQHMRDCSSISSKILSSRSTRMDIIPYGGTSLVPIAVPFNCFKVFSLTWKNLFSKTSSASSNKASVVTFFSSLHLSIFWGEVFLVWDVMVKTNNINSADISAEVDLNDLYPFWMNSLSEL